MHVCKYLRVSECLFFTGTTIFCILINLGSTSDATSCEHEGGQMHNDHCYFLGGRPQRLNWTQSQESCEKEGGNLVSISNADEMSFITDSLLSGLSGVYWIGLRIFGPDRNKEWSDDSAFGFSNLKEDPLLTDQEICASINTSDAIWHQEKCEAERFYICKKKLNNNDTETTTATPMPGFCPSKWSAFGNKCFRIYYEKKNWDSAYDACEKTTEKVKNGNLAAVHSKEEQVFLVKLLGEQIHFPSPVWMGLRMVPVDGNYAWSDSTSFNWANWSPKRPKIVSESSHRYDKCVEMLDSTLRVGRWKDSDCSELRGYICQGYKSTEVDPTPTPNECNEGDHDQYRKDAYVWSSHGLSWQDAERECSKSKGGHLASINNDYEQAFLASYLNKCNSNQVWIGFSDVNKTGKFSWSDGWPTYLTNWGPDEPQHYSVERCVVLTSNMDWKVQKCTEGNSFICRLTLDKPPNITQVDGYCPSTNSSFLWTDTGLNSCYHIEHNETVPWGVALQRCQKQGGNLASFHSAIEIDLLRHHIRESDNDLWIGMEKNIQGSYEWVDGSPFDLDRWAAGEPSPQGNEKCVELYVANLMFNNAKCTSSRGYICTIDKIPIGTSSVATSGQTVSSTTLVSKASTSQTKVTSSITATTSGSTNTTSPPHEPGLSDTGIVGIVVGVVLMAVGLTVLLVFVYNKHWRNKDKDHTLQMFQRIASFQSSRACVTRAFLAISTTAPLKSARNLCGEDAMQTPITSKLSKTALLNAKTEENRIQLVEQFFNCTRRLFIDS